MNEHWTQRSLATALLCFLIVAGWKVSAVLATLQSWEGWNQPKVAGDLVMALVFGLIALAAGLGLNLGTLLRGFGLPIPPKGGNESAP